MICEIANPSDAYTLICEDFLVGAVAVALLGDGAYGLTSEDGEQRTPVLFGWDEWIKEKIGDLAGYIEAHKPAIADALDSVRIGNKETRQMEAAATKYMSEADAKTFREECHDKARSSLNNIGAKAWALAARLRGSKEPVPSDRSIILGG